MSEHEFSEQEQIRHEKRERIIAAGGQAYPVDLRRTHTLSQIRKAWDDKLENGEEVRDEVVEIGGRVIFVRNTGKLCFTALQDGFTHENNGERLQVMLSLANVGQEALDQWKADVDLGDFVWVRGFITRSKRGELSVMATEWKMASKALRPLPTMHKELSEESRVRQRYNDLIMRPEAREMVRKRAAVTKAVRDTLDAQGFIEIETPTLQLIHGGAAARPFNTHLNAFDIDMTLRIALELYLKRTMVGGTDRVYEIGRVFRNEGIDSTHSAEFTMLEAYMSWGDQFTIADVIKNVIMNAAEAIDMFEIERPDGQVIDLRGEWKWLPLYDGLSEKIGEEITVETPREKLVAMLNKFEIEFDPALCDGKLAMELF